MVDEDERQSRAYECLRKSSRTEPCAGAIVDGVGVATQRLNHIVAQAVGGLFGAGDFRITVGELARYAAAVLRWWAGPFAFAFIVGIWGA